MSAECYRLTLSFQLIHILFFIFRLQQAHTQAHVLSDRRRFDCGCCEDSPVHIYLYPLHCVLMTISMLPTLKYPSMNSRWQNCAANGKPMLRDGCKLASIYHCVEIQSPLCTINKAHVLSPQKHSELQNSSIEHFSFFSPRTSNWWTSCQPS